MNGRLQQRSDELETCPVCHGTYPLEYERRDQAPTGTIGYEQHVSGICSRACLLQSDKRGVTYE